MVQVAGSRLAGEQEYAFKHALIRDVAYSTLPKSVRARKHAEVADFIADRAADRSEGVVAMVADHFGRAATLGAGADLEPGELEQIDARALEALEAAGDVAASLYSNSEALSHYEAALLAAPASTPRSAPGSARSSATSRCGSAASTPPSTCGSECLDYHRGRGGPRAGRRPAPQDRRRPLAQGRPRGVDRALPAGHRPAQGRPSLRSSSCASTRRRRPSTCTPATTCSRSTRRRRRCGSRERLDEAAAASRAHGIFGRVFGRIGDYERARENLERSVELARDADPAEAVRALLALGYHLEVSEADYEGAAAAYAEGLELREQTGDLPSQVELHAALGAARRPRRRLGGGCARRRRRPRPWPSARASRASSASRTRSAGS